VNRNIRRMRESGQVMLLFVLLIPILAGMTGMSVDLGSYAGDRRKLQNAADSIALAAAQQLPDAASAQTIATSYANKNNIDPSRVTVTVTGGNVAPKVSVSITRPHNFAFLRMLGVTSTNVSAKAAAVKVSFGGSSGIVPWAVTQATVDGAGSNAVTMKYDATGQNTGNFGAMRIDGAGAATYTTDVTYGSNSFVCAITAPHCVAGACPGAYPTVCAETAPSCDGPECTPETGNMVGPTRNGVDYRMTHTSSTCDSLDDAFPKGTDGARHLAPACNPWTTGPGACATTTSMCSRRVIIIPVVDTFGNGASTPTTIQRFALLFLKGYEGTCTGNSCDIDAWFVKADITTNALAGSYDPTAMIHFVKLSE